MKNLYLLFGMLFSVSLFSQSYTLSTQAEVDNFTLSGNIQGHLFIGAPNPWDETNINNLQNLSGLISVSGNLTIKRCSMLTSLEGLDNLVSVGGDMTINNNDMLISFDGLNNLSYIGEILSIGFNDNITGFNGLNSLTTIETLSMSHNNSMINPTGMDNLSSLGWLSIRYTPLTDLSFMQNITSIDQMQFTGTDFKDFTGLENLTSMEGDLVLYETSFINFAGLENLTSIGGTLYIGDYNYDIYDDGYIFTPNTALLSFDGLDNLTSIGRLRVVATHVLTDFTGLENLTSIAGSLVIAFNNSLNDLKTLENINYQNLTSLKIERNPNLAACSISSICNYLEDGGTATIEYNALGCNTQPEVEEACALPIEIAVPLQVYLNNQNAILKWRTATETNNSGFEIQRSKDGTNWQRIGWQAGQGTSTTPHTYTYRDPKPLFGTSYYRLKQVDFDGNFEYSNAVSLRYIPAVVEISPNPVKDIFQVKGIPQGTYQIQDTKGRIIQSGDIENDLSIDISQEAKGVYLISIHTENDIITRRIIKL